MLPVPICRTHPVDWNSPVHKLALKEPRRGERAVLRALVQTPQVGTVGWGRGRRVASQHCRLQVFVLPTSTAYTQPIPQGPLVVYNAHLEVFCGLLARIAQLSDIFADARRQADRGYQRQAILGGC